MPRGLSPASGVWHAEAMVDVPDVLDLTAPQSRVLGCLMEKQATTPEAYPLTLKALTTACNQTSSRHPVVDYDTQLVETTALALKGKGLVRVVHPAHGERATRYRHVADEALGLDDAARAVVSVLLLRGPQTVAELRSRTERQHPFASLDEVEATLAALAGGTRPMVVQLERQPGQKEPRWLQLLEADAEGRAAAAAIAGPVGGAPRGAVRVDPDRVEQLEARVDVLESTVARLLHELGLDASDVGPQDPDVQSPS
jgi:uncharacterized protein YceH (UPF0502 family)